MSDGYDEDGFEEEEEEDETVLEMEEKEKEEEEIEEEEVEDLDELSDEEILAKAKKDSKKTKLVPKKKVLKKKATVPGPKVEDVPDEVPELLGDGGFYQLASKLDKDSFVTQDGRTVPVVEALRTACNQIDALFRVKFEEMSKKKELVK